MPKIPRIAVVGSANIDLTTFCDRFPKPGETIFGQRFDLGFGGKGANQAVASKLCGASVFMLARVGSDLFGPATIENFKKLGIDATIPFTEKSRFARCEFEKVSVDPNMLSADPQVIRARLGF